MAGKEGDAEGKRKRGGGLRKKGWRVDGHEVGPAGRKWGGMKGTNEKLEKQRRNCGGRRRPTVSPHVQGILQMTWSG